MEFAKIISEHQIEIVACLPEEDDRIMQLKNEGYLEFIASEQPICDEGQRAIDSYVIEDNKIVQSWTIDIDKPMIQNQINDLKMQLSDTDYRITKCFEYSLIGEELPYDIGKLHTERQAIRDEINRLQTILQKQNNNENSRFKQTKNSND